MPKKNEVKTSKHTKKELERFNKLIAKLEESGLMTEEDRDNARTLEAYLGNQKKYGLVWENQEENVEKELRDNYPVLTEVENREIMTDKNKPVNLLIEGDNFHSLNTLLYTHKGKVDVIYIDPPYNTGNKDFIYNDKMVDKEDAWRHSKWLSFMEKRLKIARELLSDDGVIFISIDDNEVAQLVILCDEIFGEHNRIGMISVVNNLKGRSDDKHFATATEFLICYSKNNEKAMIGGFPLPDDMVNEYKYEDNISKYKEVGLKKTGKNSRREDRPNMYYPIYYCETTGETSLKKTEASVEIFPTDSNGKDGCWRWGKETFNRKKDTEIVIRKTNKGNWSVFVKMRIETNGTQRTLRPKTVWIDPKYDTGKGTLAIKDLFGENLFTNPKPIEFIKDIIKIASTKNSRIIDFFAGSGTLGNSILELNAEDGGNRQFILCTNNENNICEDVTYQRLSKVIHGYTTPKGKEVPGLGGNLKYYKTEMVPKIQDNLDLKAELFDKCTDLLCIKENVFDLIKETLEFKIFQGHDKYVGVYYGSDFSHQDMNVFNEALSSLTERETILYLPDEFGIENDAVVTDLQKSGIEIKVIPKKIMEILEEVLIP